ncbi:MAG: helix-turn-helix domain-containing protein [Bacteroidales bacterium]|nr:helix-turn-helix domain-containing protein [Bacteroidales bacterium]
MNINNLSKNIRRIRALNGRTQEDVANDIGISLTAYNKIEQGKSDIAISRLQQIADSLKVEVTVLFQNQEESTMGIMNDSQIYRYKDKDRRVEEELQELKADVKMIKTHLFGS